MFDISWGELAVLGAVGVAVTGKRDLPRACNFVGYQLGRVVGLLQGARARADRFAHHNELKALQNELRSGLRELDQVKTELAVAASTRGVMGRTLGATTASANRKVAAGYGSSNSSGNIHNPSWKTQSSLSSAVSSPAVSQSIPTSNNATNSLANKNTAGENAAAPQQLSLSDFDFSIDNDDDDGSAENSPSLVRQQELSPVAQSERAVMEDEWAKQGIGFRAQAERGSWVGDNEQHGESYDSADTTRATGSELLEHLERQCLIFDQYDRVVGEQEAEMEKRVQRIQNQRKGNQRRNDNDHEMNKPT